MSQGCAYPCWCCIQSVSGRCRQSIFVRFSLLDMVMVSCWVWWLITNGRDILTIWLNSSSQHRNGSLTACGWVMLEPLVGFGNPAGESRECCPRIILCNLRMMIFGGETCVSWLISFPVPGLTWGLLGCRWLSLDVAWMSLGSCFVDV